MSLKTKKKVLKLSGEVLAGSRGGQGLDAGVLDNVAGQLVMAVKEGVAIAIVPGGGNIFRGLGDAASGMDRVTADEMGMLATVINGLALRDAIDRKGGKATLFTARPLGPVGKPYVKNDALADMEKGIIVIVSGGTGNPFFSTDSGAALRAAELGCDIFLKGTKVDGIFDSDPQKNPGARRYETLTYSEMLQKRLKVMDLTATALLSENGISAFVYNMTEENAIYKALTGKCRGTSVS